MDVRPKAGGAGASEGELVERPGVGLEPNSTRTWHEKGPGAVLFLGTLCLVVLKGHQKERSHFAGLGACSYFTQKRPKGDGFVWIHVCGSAPAWNWVEALKRGAGSSQGLVGALRPFPGTSALGRRAQPINQCDQAKRQGASPLPGLLAQR